MMDSNESFLMQDFTSTEEYSTFNDTDKEMTDEPPSGIPPPPTSKLFSPKAKLGPEQAVAMIQGIEIGLQSVQLDHLNLSTSVRLKNPDKDWNLLAKTLVSAVRDPLKLCCVQRFEKKHTLFMREYLWRHYKWAAQIYSKGGKNVQSKMESCKGYHFIQRSFNNRNQTITKISPVYYNREPEYPICQLMEMTDTPPSHLVKRFFSPKSNLDSEQEAAMIEGIEIGLQSHKIAHLNLETSVTLENPGTDWNVIAKTLVSAVKNPLKLCSVERFERKHCLFMREYLWRHCKWAAQVYSKGGKNMQSKLESCKGYQLIQRAFNNRNKVNRSSKTSPICFKIEPDFEEYPITPISDEEGDQMEGGEEVTCPRDPRTLFVLPDEEPRAGAAWNFKEDEDQVRDESNVKIRIKSEPRYSPDSFMVSETDGDGDASPKTTEDISTFNDDEENFTASPSQMSGTSPNDTSTPCSKYLSRIWKLDSDQEMAMIKGIQIGLKSVQLDHLNLETSVRLENPDIDWNLVAKTLVSAVKNPLKLCCVQKFEKKHSFFMREYLWKNYKWAAQVYSKGGKTMQSKLESCRGYQLIQRAFNNRNKVNRTAKTSSGCFRRDPQIVDYPISQVTDSDYSEEGLLLPTAKWSYMTIESKESFYKMSKSIRQTKDISQELLNKVKVSWDATIAYITGHNNLDFELEVGEGNLSHLGHFSSYYAHVCGLYNESEKLLDRFRQRVLLLADFFAENLGKLVKVTVVPSQGLIWKRPLISMIQILAGIFNESTNIVLSTEEDDDENQIYGCSIFEVEDGNYDVKVTGANVMSNLSEIEAVFVFATAMDAYWLKDTKLSEKYQMSDTLQFLRKYVLDRMTVSGTSAKVNMIALPFLHHSLRKPSDVLKWHLNDTTQKLAERMGKLLDGNDAIAIIDKDQ